ESFQRAQATRARQPRAFTGQTLDKRPLDLPPLNLRHLKRLTDDTGLFQHARFTVPNYREGYTTDDNARALIAATHLEEWGEESANEPGDLAACYLAFLTHAFDPRSGRFRNFMAYERHWLEEVGSEDSHGRALWALGTVIGRSAQPGLCGAAGKLFEPAVAAIPGLTNPRARGFALLGG